MSRRTSIPLTEMRTEKGQSIAVHMEDKMNDVQEEVLESKFAGS